MVYDIAGVRGRYVSLGDGWTYLNAHQYPQVPERVTSGMVRALRAAPNPMAVLSEEDTSRHSHRSDDDQAGYLEGTGSLRAARVAVADLVGATPDRVLLGTSLESLYRDLSLALQPLLRRGGGAVVSRLDRPSLTDPLAEAATEVRTAQPDLGTGELPAWQFEDLVDGGTRLVAFSAVQEHLGTVAPVRQIVETSRARSRAWVLVDASAYAPYRLVDMEQWGVDILALDLAQLGGPPLSALVFRDTRMLTRLRPLNPQAPEHSVRAWESRVPAGLAGGVEPLVDHLASFADADSDVEGEQYGSYAPGGMSTTYGGFNAGFGTGEVRGRTTRRSRLRTSMEALTVYLEDLGRDLLTFIGSLPTVHIVGVTGEVARGALVERVPRISFAVRGVPAATVHRRLLDNGILTTMTPSTPVLQDMGLDEVGGAVTVSLAPFSQSHDVEHLTRVVASLA